MIVVHLVALLFFLLLTVVAGLSLDQLPHRMQLPSSETYSTNRLLHELEDQMEHGMGARVNLEGAKLSNKKRKSTPQSDESVIKSDIKDDLYGTDNDHLAAGHYSSEEDNLGSSWESLYSYPELQMFRGQVKREKRNRKENSGGPESQELADILKDDDREKKNLQRDRKVPPDLKRQESHGKKKRQSTEPQLPELKTEEKENPDFQEWLRREYYRNMAKSFASMRRKRAGSSPVESHTNESGSSSSRGGKQIEKKQDRFEEVTDKLKAIEDALLSDALMVIKESGRDYVDDNEKRNKISNDLNAAYDLETMRMALFHLKDTLNNMDESAESEEHNYYGNYRKRGDQCPPLDILTSDCSALGDVVSDGPLQQLLKHACNWHEACYSCGQVFGLTSDDCDVGFVQQSRTICRGDVPCQSTASLLLLPLRQRRVFYKRSNPSVCLVDPCVEAFLRHG